MEEWTEYKISNLTIMKNGEKRPYGVGQFAVYGGNGVMDYANDYNAENTIIVGRVQYFLTVLKMQGWQRYVILFS